MGSGGMKTTVAGFARIQNSLNSCESSYESWRRHRVGDRALELRGPLLLALRFVIKSAFLPQEMMVVLSETVRFVSNVLQQS